MTCSLTASLASLAALERTDPAVARAAANYDRVVAGILARPLDAAEWDHVRLMAAGCVDRGRQAGEGWTCRCVWCRMAIREIVRRANAEPPR